MKIGIVIPYYENSEEAKERMEYLLDIISPQIKKNIELVVIDDGMSALWLDEYSKKNIEIIHMHHVGVSESRNIGIRHLKKRKCEYIGFIDGDDSVSNDYIEEAYKVCKEGLYDYIDSRYIQSGVEVFGTRELANKQLNIVRNGVAGAFFSSKLIGKVEFDKELKNGEDTDFVRKVVDISKIKKGLFKGMYVYNYGVNPESIIMRCQKGEEL